MVRKASSVGISGVMAARPFSTLLKNLGACTITCRVSALGYMDMERKYVGKNVIFIPLGNSKGLN